MDVVTGIATEARKGSRKILVYAATGAGKTTVFSYLAERLSQKHDKPGSCMVVIHRKELAEQAAARLSNRGLDVGVTIDGKTSNPHATVQVISIQTLARRDLGAFNPRLVIIDEAHHCVAPTWRKVLDHGASVGAISVLFTATPWDAKGRSLGVADALVRGPTPAALRDLGVLVDPTIYAGPTPNLDGVGSSGGDFIRDALAERTNLVVADVVKTWKRLADGRRTIAFAVDRAHSRRLVQEWIDAGVPAEHVDGSTPTSERDAIFERLREGKTLVVSNVGVVTEGFDCPDVSCGVLARPTQSEGLYVQMVGRVLRGAPGKDSCIILDHGYNALRHGHPMMDRPITLGAGRVNRKAAIPEKDLADASPHFRICGGCMMAIAGDATACPNCSAAVPPRAAVKEKRSLELVKFTELSAEQRQQVKVLERRAAWYAMEAARQPGTNPWETSYRYARRFGVMPHEDRIFLTKQERMAYWLKRKGRSRGR